MDLKDLMRADLSYLFNETEFASQVVYESAIWGSFDLLAIVDFKEDTREDVRGNHRIAELWIARTDTPEVKYNDKVLIDGEEWQVIREISSDEDIVKIEVRRDLRARNAR